jgi:hypothetical protein
LFTRDDGLPFGFLIYLYLNRVVIISELDVILDKCRLIGQPVPLPKIKPDLDVKLDKGELIGEPYSPPKKAHSKPYATGVHANSFEAGRAAPQQVRFIESKYHVAYA